MLNKSNIINSFSILINQYGFKQPKKIWSNDFVSFTKHLDDFFYCYVTARVYQRDGSLETTMWVGPIDRPDDGLSKLCANIKVQIGEGQSVDNLFFKNCERKIINLIDSKCLTTLLEASRKELSIPSMRNYRYDVYTEFFLPFYKMVITEANDDKTVLREKKTCQLIIESVYNKLDGEIKFFFSKLGAKFTAEMIWELCYIYSL